MICLEDAGGQHRPGVSMVRSHLKQFALVPLLLLVAACSSSPGPDALSAQPGGQCTACHAPGSALDPMTTNGTGTFGKHSAHVTSMGFDCSVCHSQYTTLSSHANGSLDTTNPAVNIVYFDTASNPTGTWNDALGTCSSLNCHGTDTLKWYGNTADMAGYQSCTSCHSYPLGARRRVTGTAGDFGLNPAIVSNHVTTTNDPAPAQCKVCHDQTNHTQGTVRLRNADTGAILSYATPTNLETFCLSCHDSDGATTFVTGGTNSSPFNDNNTLGIGPNVAGARIKDYWTGTNNRHKTTGVLTCAGTGATGTGCHGNNGSINMHGSVSKGLLTKNLTLPVLDTAPSYSYNYFKLCFDCHTSYAAVSPQVVLGYRLGGNYDVTAVPRVTDFVTSSATIQSLFRERYIDPVNPLIFPGYWGGISPVYNDTIGIDVYPYLPLHNYHLFSTFTFFSTSNVLTWKYRGDPAQVGRITCVTCHNVHGTNGGSARGTFEELGVTIVSVVTGTGTDQYGTMTDTDRKSVV